MSRLFYLKLAISNIKKNNKTYVPFIITCVCTIMLFYIMHSISIDKELDGVNGSRSLKIVLGLGVNVIGIFSTIFIFYTNSFLIKRRKKELGLYNVLGLEKKHIAKIMFFETLIILIISLLIGLVTGIILNKLMFLLLLKLLNFPTLFGFYISLRSILITVILFIGIFFIILLSNLLQIKRTNPIELLKGSQHGEREPKSKWIMATIGLITTALGYTIALSVKSPLAAINYFFIAVILVMIGTYALFTTGSIVLLKQLRKNKKLYYKTSYFISISSMIYRMKQNAVGLANICILSTAVLVMLSTTISLYIGMEDVLRFRFPRDVLITGNNLSAEDVNKLNEILNYEISESDLSIKNKVDYYNKNSLCKQYDEKFILGRDSSNNIEYCFINAIPITDYNRLENKNLTLADDEVIIFSVRNTYGKDKIIIDNKNFKVKDELNSIILSHKYNLHIADSYIIILNDIDAFGDPNQTQYVIEFDVDNTNEEIITFTNNLNQKLQENNISVSVDSAANNRDEFLAIYGALFFLGIFLGALFLIATVLIIYYKQISEGYDDKERFEIMQKVGISKTEIKKTIKSQILIVFFLPLVFSIIHIIFAFPIITKLLALLNLTNVLLFSITTIITIFVFIIIYLIVFSLTAKTYYKIVE